jgi:hypothetical protein
MASNLFLDANFLLDFTLQRTGLIKAKKIVDLAISSDIQFCTAPASTLNYLFKTSL